MTLSELSQNVTNDIFRIIHKNSGNTGRYRSFTLDYSQPVLFELNLTLKITSQLNPKSDQFFKNLPSEIIRFEKFGFAVDGDSFGGDPYDGPEIGLIVATDLSQINSTKLKARILDVVRHEIEHLLQRGDNFSIDHKVKIPRANTRNLAKGNYQYFILSDEIPAQVRGLEEESIQTGDSVRTCAINYLTPFLELGFITNPELQKVLSVWEKWAIEHNIKFD